MSSLDVVSSTQVIEFDTITQVIDVPVKHVIVDALKPQLLVVSSTNDITVTLVSQSVCVTKAGPPGPRGYSSRPSNLAQAAFYDATGLDEKTIDYLSGLPSVIKYYENAVLRYESTITYVDNLPTLISLVRQVDNETFEKEITYSSRLPVAVEWRVA